MTAQREHKFLLALPLKRHFTANLYCFLSPHSRALVHMLPPALQAVHARQGTEC